MRTIVIKQKKAPIWQYFCQNTTGARMVYNTANFLIRNVMTAVKKDMSEWTDNEAMVMARVAVAVIGYNEHGLDSGKKDFHPVSMPTAKKWMLSYEFLDYLLKSEKNEAYYYCISHVNQHAIRKAVRSWKSYFALLRKYKSNPGSMKKPGIPKYIRSEGTTAHFTNQVAKLIRDKCGNCTISFTKHAEPYAVGKLPEGDLSSLEVIPKHGLYYVHLTFEDDAVTPAVPAHPARIMGVDPGVSNFLAVATNVGLTPFIIDGKVIKAENRYFNKEKAAVLGVLRRGHNTKDNTVPRRSIKTDRLSDRRENRLRDWFYRIGHHLFRYAKENDVEVIVLGHNENQKQEIKTGKQNNQNFASIPYYKFCRIMTTLSCQYGIPVVIREESYTSQASLLDKDDLPTYKAGDTTEYTFSGKRVHRGLYRSKDGMILNADVNGAGNIIRKEYPYAFDDVKDWSYLWKTTKRVTLREILIPDPKGLAEPHAPAKPRKYHASRKSSTSKKRAQAKRKLKHESRIPTRRAKMPSGKQAA